MSYMAKYIPLDAVLAEIEKRQAILDIDSPLGIGGMIELEYLKTIILPTLEVKEVNSNDAFIEKAAEWLRNNLEGIVGGDIYIEDFVNYMKEE